MNLISLSYKYDYDNDDDYDLDDKHTSSHSFGRVALFSFRCAVSQTVAVPMIGVSLPLGND